MSTQSRFWEKVNQNGPIPEHRPELGACWLWTGEITRNGYGRFWLNGRLTRAHHFLTGQPEKGFESDHLCRTRHCVRPEHLEVVTHSENVRRGLSGPEFRAQLVTHCPQGHAYNEQNTYYHGTHRFCRACHAAKERMRYARRRIAELEASAG